MMIPYLLREEHVCFIEVSDYHAVEYYFRRVGITPFFFFFPLAQHEVCRHVALLAHAPRVEWMK